MNSKLILIFFLAILASACAVGRDRPVGLLFRHYSDPSRRSWSAGSSPGSNSSIGSRGPRPLETLLWYPAKKGTKVSSHTVAIFKTGVYAVDAGHYVFLCEGSFKGKLVDGRHLIDPWGVDRAKVHEPRPPAAQLPGHYQAGLRRVAPRSRPTIGASTGCR